MKTALGILFLISLNYGSYFEDGLSAYASGNIEKAVILYKKACDSGNMEGCFNIGPMYIYDDRVRVIHNRQKSDHLFKKACHGGNIEGCFNLGLMYIYGDGVRQNKQKAVISFKKACDGGYVDGCKHYKILTEPVF